MGWPCSCTAGVCRTSFSLFSIKPSLAPGHAPGTPSQLPKGEGAPPLPSAWGEPVEAVELLPGLTGSSPCGLFI